MADLALRLDVEREYGEEIRGLLESAGLPVQAYDVLVADLQALPEGHRAMFLEGLDDMLEAARGQQVLAGKVQLTSSDLANLYREQFTARVAEVEAENVSRLVNRTALVGAALACIVGLVGFLVVPLLAQIEANTGANAPPARLGSPPSPR